LRDTVASAQAGNKIGASLQSLETAMSAVRAAGFNRINMNEIAMPASAGSSWDRIQGWFGKATAGEPVPKDIQNDMLQFADVLERGAAQKYARGWQATTKRYGLDDEQPLVNIQSALSPAEKKAPPPSPPPSGRIRVKGPHGESGTMPAG